MALKYSRQREAIKEFMMGRKDHPTADVVYMNVRKEFPNISLGTVYRNLTLLSDMGELSRIRVGDGVDHFDAITTLHYHFICQECGSVHDLNLPVVESFNQAASGQCDGLIEGHVAYFYGKCNACLKAGLTN
ncbi:MAG: transcriptional repressor [Lachnospiraceae bacterium]